LRVSGEFGTLAFDEGNASVRKTVEKYPHSAPGTVLVSYNPITGTAVEATPPSGTIGSDHPGPGGKQPDRGPLGQGIIGRVQAIRGDPIQTVRERAPFPKRSLGGFARHGRAARPVTESSGRHIV
jgi:hypothetical protein